MSLSISPYSTHDQQLQQASTFIRNHLIDFKFRNEKYYFLPLPIIEHIASKPNILAVIMQDPALAANLAAIPNPSHSHDFLKSKIFNHAKRCFSIALYAKLSMLFLRQLTNVVLDENLPIDEVIIEEGLEEDTEEFMDIQSMFCAPVMKVGDYEQKVEMVPIEAIAGVGLLDNGEELFVVEFHEGHVEEGEASRYGMMVCKDMEEAEKTEVWKRRKLGFWWEDEYFLCYE